MGEALNVEAFIYLEERCEEYVRAEDHERPVIIHSSFRHIWSSKHPEWDWEKDPDEENAVDYNRQREVNSFQIRRQLNKSEDHAGHALLVSHQLAHSWRLQAPTKRC